MKQQVQKHYNRISRVYERRKREFYLRMVRKSLGQVNFRRMADLGCGTGLALSWFQGERVGVDFSIDLLRRAHKGPDYVLADIENLPFREESFDLVLCLDVAEHLPSLRVVGEARRILMRNGVFHLSTADTKYGPVLELLELMRLKLPEGPHAWRNSKEIAAKFEESGFSCVQSASPPIRFYKATKL